MTIIYLTRHGQTEWNVEGRMQGHKDSPLTQQGKDQAKALSDAMANIKIDYIYSSPSLRAFHTAEIIKGNRQISIESDDRLKEINMGNWEGQIATDIEREEPDTFYSFWNTPHLYHPKSGESFLDVQNRVIPVIKELIEKHPQDEVMIVSHTVVIKTIMTYYEGRPLETLWNPPFMHPTSLSKIKIVDGSHEVLLHADTSHFKA